MSSFPLTLGAMIFYKKQVHNKKYVVNNPVGGKFMSGCSFGGIAPPCSVAAKCLCYVFVYFSFDAKPLSIHIDPFQMNTL